MEDIMEEEYISDEIFEQIKNFVHYKLTIKQRLLIDKLIINEELKKRYKWYGLCKECNQPNTGKAFEPWCQSCNAKHFQQNFQNWTSGNLDVDEFIRKSQLNAKKSWEALEWFDYNKFENVEYIAKGGFGTIYKANYKDGVIEHWNNRIDQWVRNDNVIVALKCLNNSKDISLGFLNEINLHLKMNASSCIVRCYGITKDPETDNFMMVMQYAEKGNLRQRLNKHFSKMNWENKFKIMRDIAIGLIEIHNEGLVHQDFHSGNILSFTEQSFSITDLGLCRPANEISENNDNKQIYGVLPYVAPEILLGKGYTQASDIYSFGIIAFEVCTGFPPYHDVAHDEFLAIRICQGLRPKTGYTIPQLVLNLIKQCCDADPLNRPKAGYLNNEFARWHLDLSYEDTEIYKQVIEVDKSNKRRESLANLLNGEELGFVTHPQATYTSKPLKFNQLPEPKNAENFHYSKSTEIDFTKSTKVDELNKNHEPFTNLSNNDEYEFVIRSQVIYTNKSLNINLVPEPTNADDDENFQFSNSTLIDFTKI